MISVVRKSSSVHSSSQSLPATSLAPAQQLQTYAQRSTLTRPCKRLGDPNSPYDSQASIYLNVIMVDILSLDEKTNWKLGGVMDRRGVDEWNCVSNLGNGRFCLGVVLRFTVDI